MPYFYYFIDSPSTSAMADAKKAKVDFNSTGD